MKETGIRKNIGTEFVII